MTGAVVLGSSTSSRERRRERRRRASRPILAFLGPGPPRGAAVFLHPDAGTSTSRGDHHRAPPRLRCAGSSSPKRRFAPLRSAPLRAAAGRGTRTRGQYNCRRVQSVEILLSPWPMRRSPAAPTRRVARRRDAGTRIARNSRFLARSAGRRLVGRSARVVNWSPADCTAPPSVQSAAIDASDRCVARNSRLRRFSPFPKLDAYCVPSTRSRVT